MSRNNTGRVQARESQSQHGRRKRRPGDGGAEDGEDSLYSQSKEGGYYFFPLNESFQSTGEFCNSHQMIKLKLNIATDLMLPGTGHRAQLRLPSKCSNATINEVQIRIQNWNCWSKCFSPEG